MTVTPSSPTALTAGVVAPRHRTDPESFNRMRTHGRAAGSPCLRRLRSCKLPSAILTVNFIYRELLCYPTPINCNYWYGIGLLLVLLLVNQVITGIQLGSYYIVSIDLAFSSVDYLMREITYGWSFRYLHSSGGY
jgi:hypothetical protein